MKASVVVLSAVFALSGFAANAQASSQCLSNAAALTQESINSSGDSSTYDADGFEAVGCEVSTRGSAVLCTVAASKGEGAAIDTYLAVLNKSCSKLLRLELIGEE